MAESCVLCEQKLQGNENVVSCKNCGTKYCESCWNRILKCDKCGFSTPLGIKTVERQMQEQGIEVQNELKRRQEADARRLAEEQARQKAEQEKYQARINHLKNLGRDGYYEYKVISLVDKRGAVDTEKLMAQLNDLGLDGWRLQCAYTNEMGKDSLSIAGFGINSTADQNILIFERFVKFE